MALLFPFPPPSLLLLVLLSFCRRCSFPPLFPLLFEALNYLPATIGFFVSNLFGCILFPLPSNLLDLRLGVFDLFVCFVCPANKGTTHVADCRRPPYRATTSWKTHSRKKKKSLKQQIPIQLITADDTLLLRFLTNRAIFASHHARPFRPTVNPLEVSR